MTQRIDNVSQSRLKLKMASVERLIANSGLRVTQIVVGIVVETTGVVTRVPGYDFKLTVHTSTKDEDVLFRHNILVPANGLTLAEFRFAYIGKHVLTVKDEHGRAISPIKGRCFWKEKR